MSSLMSRGAVLTASRLSNFGIMLISPLLLVRILDVEAYGQYQEFMIYASLFVAISTFAIDSSLTYFLPKHEKHEATFVSQTSILIFVVSSLCLAILVLAQPAFSLITSYDFVLPLVAYVFCFVNLGWIEYYWIATKRTDLVLYYSAARLLLRVSVLLIVAYVTRDVGTIIWSLVAVEAIRLVLVAGYLLKNKLLTPRLRWALIKAQLRFALPLGVANLSGFVNKNAGKLFISAMMGPTALAYYAIGSYLMPVIHIVRQSIGDVVFPELVRGQDHPERVLSLWQRTNVMYCVLLFPAFVFLFFFAELIVTTLFTPAYIEAVPVFQVYLLFLLRRCFNLDVLLRSRGRTGFILYGGLLALGVNVALMLLFHRAMGFIGPAVAYIVTSTLLELYYAYHIRRVFQKSAVSLIDWRGVWKVSAGCAAGFPVLFAAECFPGPDLFRAAVASAIFVAICWLVAYRLGVSDIGRLIRFAFSLMQRSKLSKD